MKLRKGTSPQAVGTRTGGAWGAEGPRALWRTACALGSVPGLPSLLCPVTFYRWGPGWTGPGASWESADWEGSQPQLKERRNLQTEGVELLAPCGCRSPVCWGLCSLLRTALGGGVGLSFCDSEGLRFEKHICIASTRWQALFTCVDSFNPDNSRTIRYFGYLILQLGKLRPRERM